MKHLVLPGVVPAEAMLGSQNQTRVPNKTKRDMAPQTSETAELQTQAYEALKSAGLPIQQQNFPEKYHHEALLRACPSIPTPRGQPLWHIQKALSSSYTAGSFEAFQAQLAGALIHLMFLYPATCLKALHSPEARPIFQMAAGFDWDEHVRKLQTAACQPAESTSDEEL
jgi:hypothetical protein